MSEQSLLAEVLAFAQPGDKDMMPAVSRFLEAEDKRKRRSCRPIDHLLLRLDLRSFPFPVVARAKPNVDGIHRITIRALIGETELAVDVGFAENEFTRPLCPGVASDYFTTRMVAALRDLWLKAFDYVFRVRSASEADDLLAERELEHGFEFDGKVREAYRLDAWEKCPTCGKPRRP